MEYLLTECAGPLLNMEYLCQNTGPTPTKDPRAIYMGNLAHHTLRGIDRTFCCLLDHGLTAVAKWGENEHLVRFDAT